MKRSLVVCLTIFTGIALLFAACADDGDTRRADERKEQLLLLYSPFMPGPVVDYRARESAVRGRLVTSQIQWNLPLAYASSMTQFSGYPELASNYAVAYYTINYETLDLQGSLVTASGCVWVPVVAGPLPVFVFCHGTNISTSVTSQHVQVGIFAGQGYFAAGPDYLGYVASESQGHPYVHAATLASSTVDLLRAAKKFAEYNGIVLGGKLFVAGYSEGGMAALATVRLLEQSYSSVYPITAAAVGSGPYDLRGSVDALLQPGTIVNPNNVVFLVTAYSAIYADVTQPLSYYLKEPYATMLTQDAYPRPDSGSISALLPKNTSDLLNPSFISSYTGSGETALKARLTQNNTCNFVPVCNLRLYAGVGDTIVPSANTVTAYNYFVGNGATRVSQVVLDASYGDHGPLALPIFSRLLAWFAAF